MTFIVVAESAADILFAVFTSVPFFFAGPIVLTFFTTI